jgi:glycosyltransferase involved in cell wall biosynthesis
VRLRHADVAHIFSASYWSFLLAPAPALCLACLLRKCTLLHCHSGEAQDHLSRWGRRANGCGGWPRPLPRGSIRFLGRVERLRVPDVYDQDDIFVNAALIDNQPVPVLEAFAAGLPDEPIAFPSSVALYCFARLASAHVNVVLTGDGPMSCFSATIAIALRPGTSGSAVPITAPYLKFCASRCVRACNGGQARCADTRYGRSWA